MGYSYSDLKRVENKIQELNGLCRQCETLNAELCWALSEPAATLKLARDRINEQSVWSGADADSCAEAILRLEKDINDAQSQFKSNMQALHSALMDEVGRQQTQHHRIYNSLNTVEIMVGQALDG